MRLLWQPNNRVNQNSRYTSHSIEKKLSQKLSNLNVLKTLLKYVWAHLWNQDRQYCTVC